MWSALKEESCDCAEFVHRKMALPLRQTQFHVVTRLHLVHLVNSHFTRFVEAL